MSLHSCCSPYSTSRTEKESWTLFYWTSPSLQCSLICMRHSSVSNPLSNKYAWICFYYSTEQTTRDDVACHTCETSRAKVDKKLNIYQTFLHKKGGADRIAFTFSYFFYKEMNEHLVLSVHIFLALFDRFWGFHDF